MPNSPLLYGPNNQATNLQNSILQASGRQLTSDGAKNYLVNPGFERGDLTGWSTVSANAGSGTTPAWVNTPGLAIGTGQIAFTVTSANATVGATYTNNAQTFTVLATIAASTVLICSFTGNPTASGTLTKSGGTGDATITFSAFLKNTPGGMTSALVSSGQIAGNSSVNLTVNTSSGGDAFISDVFSIDKADQAHVLSGRIAYLQNSGTSPDYSGRLGFNLWAVFVYDVTNGAWIQPAGVANFVQSSGVGYCTFSFQAASNAVQYQVAVIANSPTAILSTYFDDFYLGPQTSAQAPAMSDMVAYTPVFTGLGTVSANTTWSSRIGDKLYVSGRVTAGTCTAVPATMTIGYNGASGNVSTDTNKVGTNTVVGSAWTGQGSTTIFSWSVLATGGTSVTFGIQSSTVSGITSNTNATVTVTTGQTIEYYFIVPIVGWSSNTVSSADTDTRVIAFGALQQTPTGTLTTSFNVIKFGTVAFDDVAGYSTSTGLYTAAVSGKYQISGVIEITGTYTAAQKAVIAILKNGAINVSSGAFLAVNSITTAQSIQFSGEVVCSAGDTLGVYALSNGASLSYTAVNTASALFINRLSGPAVVQATESVNMSYTTGAGQTLANNTATTIVYGTKSFDSHGQMNASTGVYTIPVSGKYLICGTGQFGSVALVSAALYELLLMVNGAVVRTLAITTGQSTATASVTMSGSAVYAFNGGDTVNLQMFQNTGGSKNLSADATANNFSLTRVGN